MRALFDSIEPFNSFMLEVSELHSIYVEEVGSKTGIPIIFIHGGPGGGLEKTYRQYFDPAIFRVILFEQRGCGRSKPFGELKDNTTWDMVADMEKIRCHLGIEKWNIFGGSWGSTLALTYAITHPQCTLSLTLRGIFLLRKQEIDWFYQDGAGRFYPEEWERYLAVIPVDERSDLVAAYRSRLNSDDKVVVSEASRAWSAWEGATSKLVRDEDLVDHFSEAKFSYAFARIENHYFYHKGFFNEDNWILNNIHKISDIPGAIVQGRYDMPCPPVSAYDLHKSWPKSELLLIEEAGHSLSEKGISQALLQAVDKLAKK